MKQERKIIRRSDKPYSGRFKILSPEKAAELRRYINRDGPTITLHLGQKRTRIRI